jgi:GNAT superfamily N-acetyltransferase
VTCAEGETPDSLRRQVRAAQEEAWPSDAREDAMSLAPVHDPTLRPLSMILVDDDSVLAALDVLFKRIEHDGRSWDAAGLSTVVTPRANRGRGFGHLLVAHAFQTMPDLGADLGLFTCDRPLQAFYENCGWETLPGTVLIGGTADEPFASDCAGMDKVTLGGFFSPAAREARPTFLGAQLQLHSGSIDRLW